MKYRFTTILSLLFFTASLIASEPTGEYTKSVNKEFNNSSNGLVHLSNKYGKVEVHPWDQNSVQINVLIKVDAPTESKAKEIFDKIKIEFENSDDYVKAWTNLEDMSKKWSWGKTNKYKYSIDYEVKAPSGNELFIHNKYGNTYVGNFRNDVELDIKYGNLTLGEIDGAVKTSIKYGNAQFQDMGNLTLDCGYSNVKGMEAGDLTATSKYSKISFDKAGDAQITSKYDEYNIAELSDFRNTGKYDSFKLGKVRNVEFNSKYSNISATELLRNAEIELEYGGVKLKNISPASEIVDIEGKHTSVKLYTNGSYQLISETKYTDVNLPKNFTTQKKVKDGRELFIKGYAGSSDADTKIIVKMKYGNISIKQ